MNQIAAQDNNLPSLSMDEQELVTVLTNSLYPNASLPSVKMVLSYCKASGLDPMQKPVHIVPMWDGKSRSMRDVIMPGVGLYRTQAARGGDYAGVTEPEFGEDVTEDVGGTQITYPKWCKVTVKRRLSDGVIVDFTAVERWKENYAVRGGKDKSIAPNAMWSKRPYGQLAKCAEAQALRKAFPEIGAQPTAEEMEGKSFEPQGERDITPVNNEPVLLPVYPSDKFEQNFPKWEKVIQAGKKLSVDVINTVESSYTLTDEQKSKLNKVKVAA